MKKFSINPLLWGSSVAMSWTWGLGLFFSVQMAVQFGMPGLLAFLIPNSLGLVLFGLLTHHAASKRSGAEFEEHFFVSIRNYRWVFLLYQVIALGLTFFAALRYLMLPMGISLPLGLLLLLGATLILGEQFNIARIKFSHTFMLAVAAIAALGVALGVAGFADVAALKTFAGAQPIVSWNFLGIFVAMLIGLLLGPWLDIQQWQRAIQIHREGSSIRLSFGLGALLFFCILLFHGTLASMVFGIAGTSVTSISVDGMFNGKDSVMRYLFGGRFGDPGTVAQLGYVAFLVLMLVSTLDSGYVSLKWFLADTLKRADNAIFSLIPTRLVASPLGPVLLAAIIGLVSVPLHVELEYFMSFFATFAVGYALLVLFRASISPRPAGESTTTVFALASLSLGLFGIGYFQQTPLLMIGGTLIPFVHALMTALGWVPEIVGEKLQERRDSRLAAKTAADSGQPAPSAPKPGTALEIPVTTALTALGTQGASTWLEGKWFVHTFMSTYADTNSVGNVYFAQYALWVGKTRELFFRHAMPGFDLTKTSFFILTREFQHKFVKEAREFEQIFVKIKIASFNRKFVTLEHEVLDGARTILGKGRQVLLFVSSKDYTLLDLPVEVQKAFLPYTAGSPPTTIPGGVITAETP